MGGQIMKEVRFLLIYSRGKGAVSSNRLPLKMRTSRKIAEVSGELFFDTNFRFQSAD